MTRTKVRIEKETKKACLVADDEGRKGWIQKRWLGDDSTVNSKTFEKAVDNYNQRQADYEEGKKWANDFHKVIEIAKETEKAIAVKAYFDAYNIERDITRLIWIPKSLMKDGCVPGWFIAKKITELEEEFYLEHNTGMILMSVDVEDCENRF